MFPPSSRRASYGAGEAKVAINFTTVAVDGEVLCLWLQQP